MENKYIISVLVILAVAVFVFSGVEVTPTGYVAGGGTHGAGKQQGGNPNFGVIKGYTEWVIRDVDNNIINTETPSESVHVYFTPLNVTVNWDAAITCTDPIQGTVTNADADDSGSACTSTDYHTPTAYECIAEDTEGGEITIYRTSTDTTEGNQGCFAAKVPAGDYDIYI